LLVHRRLPLCSAGLNPAKTNASDHFAKQLRAVANWGPIIAQNGIAIERHSQCVTEENGFPDAFSVPLIGLKDRPPAHVFGGIESCGRERRRLGSLSRHCESTNSRSIAWIKARRLKFRRPNASL
jgi:hypothetical protein